MAGVDVLVEIFSIIKFILVWFWWLILLAVMFFMKTKWSKYPVDVVIIEKRGNNLIKTNDRAGKFQDPYTQIVGYKLQKSGDTIPILSYDWVLHNTTIYNTFLEKIVGFLRGNIGTIFLFRYGSKQYKPINISFNGNNKISYQPVKDVNGEDVVINIYHPFDPRDKLGLLDFEVVDWDNMNFMVQEQRASIERRTKRGDWIKTVAVPLAIIGATIVMCIIMIKYGYDFGVNLKGSAPPPQTTPSPNIPIISDIVPGQ